MRRPSHLAVAGHNGSSRAGSIAIVVALHVAAIFGLVAALNQGALMRQLQVLRAAIDTPKEIPRPPPPPPPDFVKPPPPVAIAPVFSVASPAPAPITTVPKLPPAAPAPPVVHAPASNPLRPILRTHTLPPYPPIARRLNEEGTSLIEVTVTTRGTVSDCVIAQSSGSQRLDTAACDYVKQHWRWEPPTIAGKAVSAKTRIAIKWNLRQAD